MPVGVKLENSSHELRDSHRVFKGADVETQHAEADVAVTPLPEIAPVLGDEDRVAVASQEAKQVRVIGYSAGLRRQTSNRTQYHSDRASINAGLSSCSSRM